LSAIKRFLIVKRPPPLVLPLNGWRKATFILITVGWLATIY